VLAAERLHELENSGFTLHSMEYVFHYNDSRIQWYRDYFTQKKRRVME